MRGGKAPTVHGIAIPGGGALAAAAVAALVWAGPAAASAHRSLLGSRLLWATVDVCSPSDQPDTIGVRGSMPGDGRAGDRMYMSFSLQMREGASGRWRALPGARPAPLVAVGAGTSPRQGGSSFVIGPVAGRTTFVLRGLVAFQWRHGGEVVARATRTTSAGHRSVAGADPSGFSAASCSIG